MLLAGPVLPKSINTHFMAPPTGFNGEPTPGMNAAYLTPSMYLADTPSAAAAVGNGFGMVSAAPLASSSMVQFVVPTPAAVMQNAVPMPATIASGAIPPDTDNQQFKKVFSKSPRSEQMLHQLSDLADAL